MFIDDDFEQSVLVAELDYAGHRIRACQHLRDALQDRIAVTNIGKAAIATAGIPGLVTLYTKVDERVRQHIAVQWTGLRDAQGRRWRPPEEETAPDDDPMRIAI
ncbi:MAG: hypothetical protein AAF390_15950 [Pseudomonadota bacterium]